MALMIFCRMSPTILVILFARKTIKGVEIILAAGALFTPQLLMVSGIGPASTLTPLGIPVISNNPNVGAGYQERPVVTVAVLSPTPVPNTTVWLEGNKPDAVCTV